QLASIPDTSVADCWPHQGVPRSVVGRITSATGAPQKPAAGEGNPWLRLRAQAVRKRAQCSGARAVVESLTVILLIGAAVRAPCTFLRPRTRVAWAGPSPLHANIASINSLTPRIAITRFML